MIEILLAVFILFCFPAHAQTQVTQAASAKAGRPDAEALYKEYSGRGKLMGDSVVPSGVASKDPKADFIGGVKKVVNSIEKGEKIELQSYGDRSDFLDVDKSFGIPEYSMGCVVRDGSIPVMNYGMNIALEWYSKRGIYPVNSLKKKMATAIKTGLNWLPLKVGSTALKLTGPVVYLSAEDRETSKQGDLHFSYHTIFVQDGGKTRTFRSMYIVPYPASSWAYDKATDSIWIESRGGNDAGEVIRSFDLKEAVLNTGIQNTPKTLVWHRICTRMQLGKSEGVFVKKEAGGAEIYFQKANQSPKRVDTWYGERRWLTSFWAYDGKKETLWIKEHGPSVDRHVFQVDRSSLKVIASFQPLVDLQE